MRIFCTYFVLSVASITTMAQQVVQKAVLPFRNTDEGTKVVSANTKFALSLYREILKTQSDQNVFLSPFSISVALAMTYLGARENTAVQMKQVLNFDKVEEAALHGSFSELHDAFHGAGGNYTLRVANQLFGDKTFEVLQEFLDLTVRHYKAAKFRHVDFRNNTEAARAEINEWVGEQTAQKIKDILPPGSVNALTSVVIVNAIYFKGDWDNKFDATETKEMDFHAAPSETIKVQMMYKKAKWNYGINRDLDAQCLELPYTGKSLSMFVILPGAGKMKNLDDGLTVDHLMDIEKSFRMNQMDVHVWLPRFKLTDSFNLSDRLVAMGMGDLFDMAKANLKGIDAQNRLFVDKVLHKAFIEVNEEGSEAAAATAVVMMLRAMPKQFNFKADHPFVFFIRENSTKSILFFGKVVRPEAVTGKDEL